MLEQLKDVKDADQCTSQVVERLQQLLSKASPGWKYHANQDPKVHAAYEALFSYVVKLCSRVFGNRLIGTV